MISTAPVGISRCRTCPQPAISPTHGTLAINQVSDEQKGTETNGESTQKLLERIKLTFPCNTVMGIPL